MPDRRKHRGPHPDDARLFAPERLPALRQAGTDLYWLLSRGYADKSALKLVGDRYELEARQRLAIWRSACSDQALAGRKAREVPPETCAGLALGIDGYNVLVTVESALAGGAVLVGRDGCFRDLASVHGTYRRVAETIAAVERIAEYAIELGVSHVDWYLDRPVSNSARLKALMAELLESRGRADRFNIELADSPDWVLSEYSGIVATADGPVLDRCGRWVNLARDVVAGVPGAWVVKL
ncbi:MAG: DUF434 domain-containing protein [Phycisphaerae bacterium]|nr:DUF434 domain-containing protein [Phycisphaerae bacterium]